MPTTRSAGSRIGDEAWAIRYLVVATGSWLSSRKVLISPIAAGKPDWAAKLLPVSLTREQVKNSANIDTDTDMPVIRQHETDCLDFYSYPHYWGGVGLWGSGGYPTMLTHACAGHGSTTATRAEADSAQARTEARQRDKDPHLRSCRAVVVLRTVIAPVRARFDSSHTSLAARRSLRLLRDGRQRLGEIPDYYCRAVA